MAQPRRSGIRRLWLPATVATALALAAVVVTRTPPTALVSSADLVVRRVDPPLSLAGPRVRYAIDGRGPAQVSYITDSGELSTESITLPWSHELVLSAPMRPASVTATTSAGGAVSCLLEVDGRLRDSRSGDPAAGVVLCSVVAA